MPKRGHLWPIWWKGKSTTMKQLFCYSSWIIFVFKIKFSGKNWVEKHIHTIVFMFGSKINEFGRVWTEKIGIWRKKIFYEKILFFFSKTFCFSDFFCQTKFWPQNLEQRPIKKRPPLKAALDLQFFIQICQRFLKLLRLS